jgi:hypothetical protein
MRRRLMRILAIGFAASCIFVVTFLVSRRATLRAQLSVHPFTATMRDIVNNGPAGTHTRYYTIAVRSDGTRVWARRDQAPDGTWNLSRTITDPNTGKRVSIDDLTKSISSIFLGKRVLANLEASLTECRNSLTGIKTSNLLGYAVVEKTYSGIAPHGNHFTQEVWSAPELGCLALKKTTTWTGAGDAVVSQHTIEAVAVVDGQPTSSLFAVPTNYTERSPGEVLKIFAERFNRPEHPRTESILNRFYVMTHTPRP